MRTVSSTGLPHCCTLALVGSSTLTQRAAVPCISNYGLGCCLDHFGDELPGLCTAGI